MTALGKRALACKGWRWMRGMLDTEAGTVVSPGTTDATLWDGGELFERELRDMAPPDLEDPATLGLLEYLVREAWAGEYVVVYHLNKTRPYALISIPMRWGRQPTLMAPTLAEALVLALEAAP